MPDVTDAEMVEIARRIDPTLAEVLHRLVEGKDAEHARLRGRLAELADTWAMLTREPPLEFDRALKFCAQTIRAELNGSPPPAAPGPQVRGLEFIFTLEVRVPADDQTDARSRLDARLPLAYAEKGCRLSQQPDAWRDEPEPGRGNDHALIAGELYELVHVEDLEPGDRIYLMSQRRTVLDRPWHPEEMRPELLRIPMSDRGGSKMGPPFERDFLVPRLRQHGDKPHGEPVTATSHGQGPRP
jgi:hypothetical protein